MSFLFLYFNQQCSSAIVEINFLIHGFEFMIFK